MWTRMRHTPTRVRGACRVQRVTKTLKTHSTAGLGVAGVTRPSAFPRETTVDPYDPSTFGYIYVGPWEITCNRARVHEL
eukprot:scaffold770_cov255-Pinguiococcus_pyrenoidosus.AAC.4